MNMIQQLSFMGNNVEPRKLGQSMTTFSGSSRFQIPSAQAPMNSLPLGSLNTLLFAGTVAPNQVEARAQAFIDQYLAKTKDLMKNYHQAAWNFNTQGPSYVDPETGKTNQQQQQEYSEQYIDLHNDAAAEAEITAIWKQLERIVDPKLRRQVEVLYNAYEGATQHVELRKAISNHSDTLDAAWNEHEMVVDGQVMPHSEMGMRRQTSSDPIEMKKLWEVANTYGNITIEGTGQTFAEEMVHLVQMRNEMAELYNQDKFGNDVSRYQNAYEASLTDREIDPEMLDRLLAEVEEATREPYKKMVAEFDKVAAEHFGIPIKDARLPWYQSGTGSATNAGNIKRLISFDANPYFEGVDIEALLLKTAKTQGNKAYKDMQRLLANSKYVRNGQERSSLYLHPVLDKGKNPHWFMTGMEDAPNTSRVFGSIDPDRKLQMSSSTETMQHEAMGHGLDHIQIDPETPVLLQDHHGITTESHAFLHEALVRDPEWLIKVLKLKPEEVEQFKLKAKPYADMQALTDARVMMVILDFERQMYRKLYDEAKQIKAGKMQAKDQKETVQELNDLWFSLREKYMMETKPTGAEKNQSVWADIPHYIGSIGYYPYYFLAEIERAQKAAYIRKEFGSLMTPGAGDYLRTYRKDGNLYRWDDLVERMTGEPLNAKALKEEYADIEIPQWQAK